MSAGLALLVGVCEVNPYYYRGNSMRDGCYGCEADVDEMAGILRERGLVVESLKTAKATQSNIIHHLNRASQTLKAGDLFVFYFSGHGGKVFDTNGDETDYWDETLVTHDGEIVDDELFPIWKGFAAGVRIVMVSDSCNSGTNFKSLLEIPAGDRVPLEPIVPLDRRFSQKMSASMIHFGAAKDGSNAEGGIQMSRYTKVLTELLKNGGNFNTYPQLHEQVRLRLLGIQKPKMSLFGPVCHAFKGQYPFTI